jgi:hypothetical protein
MSVRNFLVFSLAHLVLNAIIPTAGAVTVPRLSRPDIDFNINVVKISFLQSWYRYPAPDMVIKALRKNFPTVNPENISEDCRNLTENNRTLLGDSDPGSGVPSLTAPSEAFNNWHNGCVIEYVKNQSFASDKVLKFGIQNWDETYGKTADWNALDGQAKLHLVQSLLRWYVGSDRLLISLGVQKRNGKFAEQILIEVEKFAAKPDDLYDFLSVQGAEPNLRTTKATQIIQFLIHLADIYRF